MAVITSSIGTTGRSYSTITLWEAALGGAAGGGGNDAVGECYDDSDFDEFVTIDDATPDSVRLSVAAGERHDGTPNTGVRLLLTSDGRAFETSIVALTIEWLEINYNDNSTDFAAVYFNHNAAAQDQAWLQRCLIHHIVASGTEFPNGIAQGGNAGGSNIQNNILWDIEGTASNRDVEGIAGGSSRITNILNNTIHNVHHVNGSGGDALGIDNLDDADWDLKNNLVTDTASVAGTANDYDVSTDNNADQATNASSDSTAPTPIATEPVTSANEYESTIDGSEDLHLKTGAECIDAGTDLGTTPAGVEIDIDGRDRDAEGDTWDVGAHEFVAAVGGLGIPIAMHHYKQIMGVN